MLTAQIYANLPVKTLTKAYTYRIPDEFSFIDVGWRVLVPFGGRKVEGFVLAIEDIASPPPLELKDIVKPVGQAAWFPPVVITAARRLADFYLCPLAEILRLFIPGKGGIKKESAAKTEEYIVLAPGITVDDKFLAGFSRKKAQRRLLELLRQTPRLEKRTLREAGISSAAVNALAAANVICRRQERRFRNSYGTPSVDTAAFCFTA